MRKKLTCSARQYLNVPFRHQGRNSHIGLDCIGLIMLVAKEIGINLIDEKDYPRIPQGDYFLNKITSQLPKKQTKDIAEGDMILFNINGAPSHVGIATFHGNEPYIIHSYAPLKKVVEHRLTDDWIQKIHSIYNIIN
ncbi:MAG: DUF1287 domain-containing protein [Alphaproteobacteria bacterium]|nr:DUF1287 domain-containing protein [Alphaproteobacteria bacterium]